MTHVFIISLIKHYKHGTKYTNNIIVHLLNDLVECIDISGPVGELQPKRLSNKSQPLDLESALPARYSNDRTGPAPSKECRPCSSVNGSAYRRPYRRP